MYVVIAIIGEDNDAEEVLYRPIRNFPPEKIILILEERFLARGEKIKKDLEKFNIPIEFEKINDKKSLEDVFVRISRIKEREKGKKLLINVDTDYMSSCLALSAAFVNGVQAIGLLGKEIIAYPIMKFSYYSALSDKKLSILKKIHERGEFKSLDNLSREAKISMPLIVYHIKGTREKPGLEEMGLVKTERNHGNLNIKLTTLGELIVKGCIDVTPKK